MISTALPSFRARADQRAGDRRQEDRRDQDRLNGAGAASIATADLYLALGARRENFIMCDSKGVIYQGRTAGMNEFKEKYAIETDARTLEDALKGADVFIGLSVANCVTREMVRSMAATRSSLRWRTPTRRSPTTRCRPRAAM
jgi:malic enzyme